MKQQVVEMDFLYSAAVVKEDFSKEKLLQFLQNDQVYPIKGSIKQYKKYEQVIAESEEVEEIFFIISGYIMATKGNKRVVGFHTEQDVIGLEDLMLNSPSNYSFEVISEEVTVIRYDKVDIIEKILNAQEGYFYHYVHMQNHVLQMMKREQLLRLPSEQRISLALFRLSKMYGKQILKTNKVIFPKSINKGMIAKYTNLNPNTITAVLQKLQAEKIVESMHKSMYIDLSRLEEKLGDELN